MRTWQKIALGCGGPFILGMLLAGSLLLGIAIGANSTAQ